MQTVTTIGLDAAKSGFQIHSVRVEQLSTGGGTLPATPVYRWRGDSIVRPHCALGCRPPVPETNIPMDQSSLLR